MSQLTLPTAGDTAIGIYFPNVNDQTPPPMECRNGVWGYYNRHVAPPGRTYTVHLCEPAVKRLTIDFVLHGSGLGTEWVQRATLNDQVVLAHANSWYRPESRTDWQLLVADLAGLPALARIMRELSADARAVAIVEVLDARDVGYLPCRSNVALIASVGTGNGVADSALARLVADQHPAEGRGYCWFGGEASQARAIRQFFRGEIGWDADQLDVMGYWQRDSEAWNRRYARIGSQLFGIYEKALAEGKSAKLASEEFEAALERAGL